MPETSNFPAGQTRLERTKKAPLAESFNSLNGIPENYLVFISNKAC